MHNRYRVVIASQQNCNCASNFKISRIRILISPPDITLNNVLNDNPSVIGILEWKII